MLVIVCKVLDCWWKFEATLVSDESCDHITLPLFAIDINLDLMKIALMIFYDEIVLSSSRILRFIVFLWDH